MATLKDVIVDAESKLIADQTAASAFDAASKAKQDAADAAAKADGDYAAAVATLTGSLADNVPYGYDAGKIVIKIDGKPVFADVVDPSTVEIADPTPAPGV